MGCSGIVGNAKRQRRPVKPLSHGTSDAIADIVARRRRLLV
jgi:hypothetical protein